MITLILWLGKMMILFPFYMVYLAVKIAFFPLFWLFKKPDKQEVHEYWIII